MGLAAARSWPLLWVAGQCPLQHGLSDVRAGGLRPCSERGRPHTGMSPRRRLQRTSLLLLLFTAKREPLTAFSYFPVTQKEKVGSHS